MNDPLVHLIVVNWNGMVHLEACFDALLASDYPNARFVMVDNASSDESVAFVRRRYGADPRVVVAECGENLGWSGGNNVGLEQAMQAGADYALLLNNDTAIAPDAVSRLVRTAADAPDIGVLAPKMLLFDNPRLLNSAGLACSIAGSAWDIGIGRLDRAKWDRAAPVAGVCGGAMFIRVSALACTGLLPEQFGIYLDDLDLCLRMWNAGYRVQYCPGAVVRHKFGGTMGEGRRARRKYYLNTRNRFWLVERNFPLRRAPLWLGAMAVGECRAVARALLDREGWRVLAHGRAWLSALAYAPKALAERIRRRRAGLGTCGFWSLVLSRPLFFPGAEFPADGWYAERSARGVVARPISDEAVLATHAGRLRLVFVNCYPQIGPLDLLVRMDDRQLARTETRGIEEAVVEVPAGLLRFEARRVFDADATGERMDIGAWVRVERI